MLECDEEEFDGKGEDDVVDDDGCDDDNECEDDVVDDDVKCDEMGFTGSYCGNICTPTPHGMEATASVLKKWHRSFAM